MMFDKTKERVRSGLASIRLTSSSRLPSDGTKKSDITDGLETFDSNPNEAYIQPPGSMTYRLRGIPHITDSSTMTRLLEVVLQVDILASGLIVGSLADAPSSPYRVATFHFLSLIPSALSTVKNKVEWKYSLNASQLSLIYGDRSIGGPAFVDRHEIVFDCHFLGVTPLRSFTASQEHEIDCIALSGLGGHAFGSFKQRGDSYMWLRDTLPQDLPNARIMLFGYESKLSNSQSFQNISMLASTLRNSIAGVRSTTEASQKPLLIIAHSLGGVLVKQALIQMAKGSSLDKMNLKATYGILFFGVPSQGMNIESLVAIVGNQPNRYLLESLGKESDLLEQQKVQFPESFPFPDSEIICFFETMKSPTAQYDDGNWTMTGEPSVWVDSSSATYSRPWDVGPEYNYAINRTHSEMVKFSLYDEYYDTVRYHLQRFSGRASEVIGARLSTTTITQTLVNELHLAVRNGANKQVQACLSRGVNINARDGDMFSPLHRAAEWCDAPTIKLLLESGADVTARDKLQWTPLHVAARYNSPTAIHLLIAAGANISDRAEDNCTALHLAARYNRSPSTVKALLVAGCDINDREVNEWTPILLAARYQTAATTVKALVDGGADMSLRCDEGYMPLHLAAGRNSPPVLKVLLDAVAISRISQISSPKEQREKTNLLEAEDADGWTALHWAVRFGREENILLLKKYGANATAKDGLGRKPAETTFVDDIDEATRVRVLNILDAWSED